MKKLYLYIRLSDADDDLKFKTESESIANQRTLLYRFIRARREFDGYEVVEFIDDGYSGTNGNRPSFERMIESLKNGEANVVIPVSSLFPTERLPARWANGSLRLTWSAS